jgi:hypothetical protein
MKIEGDFSADFVRGDCALIVSALASEMYFQNQRLACYTSFEIKTIDDIRMINDLGMQVFNLKRIIRIINSTVIEAMP